MAKERQTTRRKRDQQKPKTYEIWLACKDWDLEPALVFTTTNPVDVRCWKNAVDAYEHQDFQLAAKVNGRQVAIPPLPDRWPYVVHEFGSAEAAADLERCKAEYELFQRDEFTVYELRGSQGDLVDRQTDLLPVIEHLLSLYVNSDPIGGYVIRERKATISREPKFVSYAAWLVDPKTGKWLEECDSDMTLEQAREVAEIEREVGDSEYLTKFLRVEEYEVDVDGKAVR